jgi:acylphosphatase
MRVRIRGRVQGVGFRWFVRVRARALGLAGWVANLPDGSVEVAASGDQAKLDQLRRLVKDGPDGAQVYGVEALDIEQDAQFDFPFSVRR